MYRILLSKLKKGTKVISLLLFCTMIFWHVSQTLPYFTVSKWFWHEQFDDKVRQRQCSCICQSQVLIDAAEADVIISGGFKSSRVFDVWVDQKRVAAVSPKFEQIMSSTRPEILNKIPPESSNRKIELWSRPQAKKKKREQNSEQENHLWNGNWAEMSDPPPTKKKRIRLKVKTA